MPLVGQTSLTVNVVVPPPKSSWKNTWAPLRGFFSVQPKEVGAVNSLMTSSMVRRPNSRTTRDFLRSGPSQFAAWQWGSQAGMRAGSVRMSNSSDIGHGTGAVNVKVADAKFPVSSRQIAVEFPDAKLSVVPSDQCQSVSDQARDLRLAATGNLASGNSTDDCPLRSGDCLWKLPLLGSNQDSPDPESGVLPI